MMWKLAGIALAAAAIATAPVAGAAPGTNGSDNTGAHAKRACSGVCVAEQHVTNPTALERLYAAKRRAQ